MNTFMLPALALLFSSTLLAQTYIGPVSGSLGGAGRAGVAPLEVAYLNPAALTQLKGYHMGFGYEAAYVQTTMSPTFSAGITDATDDVVIPGAFGYYKRKTILNGVEADLSDLHLAVGGFLFSKVSIGVSAHRMMVHPITGGEDLAENNVGVGVLYTPTTEFGFALVGYDILDSKDLPLTPVTAFGVNYMFPQVIRFCADATYNQKNNDRKFYAWSLGLESFVAGGFRFRAGHQWDNYRSTLTGSAGIGWQGPRLSVDYAYQKNMSRDEYRHSVDLRLEL